MTLFKLIQRFSTRVSVPVEVDEVVAYLREVGVKDEIYFWDVDVSADIVKAAIMHWEYPDGVGGIVTIADIYTERSLPPDEKRAAQVKELLHILDPEHYRVNTLKDVEALIEKIVLPPELIDFAKDGVHANSDRAAVYHMLAVLFPWATRQLLIEPFKHGKITVAQIAHKVALPEPYVAFVMSEVWVGIYDAIMGPERSRLPAKLHTFKADNSPIEVVSVPLGMNPYAYAKLYFRAMPDEAKKAIATVTVDTEGGVNLKSMSISELMDLAPA